jgi:ABC-type nitrate/sulfonate/bicarbonate transport system substrate-binding protein
MPGRDYAYDAFLIASRPWTLRNPEQVAALRAAWADACTAMNADPASARATEAQVLKLNPDMLARLDLPPYQTKLEPADLQLWINLCKERGLISKDQTASDLIA